MNTCMKHQQQYPRDGYCVYCGKPDAPAAVPLSPLPLSPSFTTWKVPKGADEMRLWLPSATGGTFAVGWTAQAAPGKADGA